MTVSATSTPVTVAMKEGVGKNLVSNLAQVPCIRYPINFTKKSVLVLLDSGSEINAVHLAFAKELKFPMRPTDVEAQKIDGTTLETYVIVVAAFSMEDKANWARFFKETFLVANDCPEEVLVMLFLILSGADINFLGRELWWRTYTTEEALSTTRRVKLVGKKEFATAALDSKNETYVVHIGSVSSNASLNSSISQLELNVHPSRRPQISSLIAKKAPTKVSAKYLDYADVFSPNLVSKLPKHTGINNHAIKLVED